jgi:4-hydroxy-2-oxoheptanedioate aldolase
MINPTDLRARIKAGDMLLGFGLGTPAPSIIEAIGGGWDFIWIDGQHGQFSYDALLHCIRTASMMGTTTILRPPGDEVSVLLQHADMAPTAMMIPMVDDKAQADAIIRALRYPPVGDRSFGGKRPIELYGFAGAIEQQPVALLQIETPAGIENAADIVGVEGADGLFFGGEDVKLRLGMPPEASIANNDQLRDALRRVADAANSAGKVAGLVAPSEDIAQVAVELGCRIMSVSTDSRFLRTANTAAQETFFKYRKR